jgi:hypothetical protein
MALPKFDGVTPNQQRFILTGSFLVDEDHHEAHKVGDRLILVSEVEVLHVDHRKAGKNKADFVRIETTTTLQYGYMPKAVGNEMLEEYALRAPAEPDQQELVD